MNAKSNIVESIFLKGRWTPYLWIFLIALALYIKTAFFGFTFMDDDTLILNNYSFLSKLTNIFEAFKQGVFAGSKSPTPFYRPLLIVSFIVDAGIGGISPFIYHITNIFLHIMASALLFLFLAKMNYRRDLAFLFSVIFTVHPALTQAVAWIPGRNDSLLAVFALVSFVALFNFLDSGKKRWFLLHGLFFAAALFTKESALGLVVLYIAYLLSIRKERLFSLHGRKLLIIWAFAVIAWFLLRNIAIGKQMKVTIFDLGLNMLPNSPAFIQYIGKMIFPFNLSVLPVIKDTSFVYGIMVVGLVLAALLTTKKPRYNFIIFGILWCAIFLSPSIIRPISGIKINDFPEHRLYLPMVGFMIMMLEMDAIKKRWTESMARSVFWFFLIMLFCGVSYAYSDNFKDRTNFWENAAAGSPSCARGHVTLAEVYAAAGIFDKAIAKCKEAAFVDPQMKGIHNTLGCVYMNKNMLKEAEAEFRKEIILNPSCDLPFANLGMVYVMGGREEEAESVWLKALDTNNNNINSIKNMAIFYYRRKDDKKAAHYVRRLQELDVEVPPEVLKELNIGEGVE